MAKTPKPTDETPVRPFADFLREQARGKTHEELSENLRDLVARVVDTGKKGSVTYTVTVAPLKGDSGMLQVSDEIRLKLPEHDRHTSIFFADDDSNLVRDDPHQLAFESLRDVSREETPAKDLPDYDPATGELREAQ